MNMDLTGLVVSATYFGTLVKGKVSRSRLRNNGLGHYIFFDAPMPVGFRGALRKGVVVNDSDIVSIFGDGEA